MCLIPFGHAILEKKSAERSKLGTIHKWHHQFFHSTRILSQPFNLQPLFEKSGSATWKTHLFFLVNHFSWTRKKIWVCRTTFLEPDFSNQIFRTRFLKPDFLNQISKNCKNWGRRIKGWLYSIVFSKKWPILLNMANSAELARGIGHFKNRPLQKSPLLDI